MNCPICKQLIVIKNGNGLTCSICDVFLHKICVNSTGANNYYCNFFLLVNRKIHNFTFDASNNKLYLFELFHEYMSKESEHVVQMPLIVSMNDIRKIAKKMIHFKNLV